VSTKQKPNTKTTTEAELVAIDHSIPQILWTRQFLSSQGIFIPTTTIYQHNKSMIMLPEHGRTSSCRRTKHLDVRYFFVTYKTMKKER